MEALTDFQIQVATEFLSTTGGNQFVLAGGAALLVHGISKRPTQDLDFFTNIPNYAIEDGLNSLVNLSDRNGWSVELVRSENSFRRVIIHGDESLLVDLARDSALILKPVQTRVGLVVAPEELAGRKLLALFDRALARDFIDVYVLATHFSLDSMIVMAQMIDPGFDPVALSEMLETIERFEDLNLSGSGIDPGELREFFANWYSSILRSNRNPQR
ncbi:MAG: nucleotidyl transferase AbiEii/AbiGii toxin family protein [Actinobacteria bacterium]|nr:nucleotidyl transferase AbiEii/AbiGii toxin family protein [Actinomycetota bacterium]